MRLSSAQVLQQVGSDPAGRDLNRADHDFYRTSPQAVLPLFQVEKFLGTVWECACGDGAISELLWQQSEVTNVLSTDLVYRGYKRGSGGVDFLMHPWPIGVVDHVVTNPPYKLAVDFALRTLREDRLPQGGKLALFCRTLWLEGSIRHKRLFQPFPPSRVWVHRKRVPMARGPDRPMQTGLISFSWYVWEKGVTGPTQLGWL